MISQGFISNRTATNSEVCSSALTNSEYTKFMTDRGSAHERMLSRTMTRTVGIARTSRSTRKPLFSGCHKVVLVADAAKQPISAAGNPSQPGTVDASALGNPIKTEGLYDVKKDTKQVGNKEKEGDDTCENIHSR